jgi:hypothetical protein
VVVAAGLLRALVDLPEIGGEQLAPIVPGDAL